MEELRRTIDEVILLYQLEPYTKDLYVEGISDKLVIDRLLKKNDIDDVNVNHVHELNFEAFFEQYPQMKSNNRAKLLVLNEIIEKNVGSELEWVSIVVDKDFDEVDGDLKKGTYILYTDYCSIELYLFNSNVLDIFFKNVLHSFPISGGATIDILTPPLVDKFFVRMVVHKLGGITKSQFTSFHRSIIVSKNPPAVQFSPQEHIQKILNGAKRMAELKPCVQYFDEFKNSVKVGAKNSIRGHDFIDLFYLFVNKIKNDIGLTVETLEKLLFQSIDFSELKKEHLFSSLLAKYSVN